MRPVKRIILTVLAAMALACLCVSSTLAAAPWWGLTSGSWPTNLHSGVARDEVQEVTVTATGGDVFWLEPVAFARGEVKFAVFPFNATHEVVQSALEGLYGVGNVEVSGGPGGERPYLVTFKGALGSVPVLPMPAEFAGFACVVEPADPCLEGSVEVSEKAKGRPDGKIIVTAQNAGDANVDGSVVPMVLEDVLPETLEVVAVEGVAGERVGTTLNRGLVVCSIPTPHQARCVFEGVLPSYEEIEVRIAVRAMGASSAGANAVTVSGGGASTATLTAPIRVGASNAFGVADFQQVAEEEGGTVATQAGVHPFQLTTVTALDTDKASANAEEQEPVGMTKDLVFRLPPGLIGNPTPLPQCTYAQFTTQELPTLHNSCEAKAAIGVAAITYNAIGENRLNTRTVPVFNLPPLPGEPARFGFEVTGVRIFLDTAVRSGGDYGVTVTVSNISQKAAFLASKVTFWGVPGDPAHDGARGWRCLERPVSETASCPAGVAKPPPFLSLPTSCPDAPLRMTVQADSWEEPHPSDPSESPLFAEYQMGPLDGCNRLQFAPEVRVTSDGTQASEPMGMNVDVHVPQTSVLNSEGLAESNVKDITVALPEGVAVNPAGGGGLQGCSEGLVGFTGFSEPEHAATFTGTLPEPLQSGVNFCSDASKIGEVTIKSPLLPAGQFLTGFVYLASQNENPFGSLIALYLIARDPVSGTVVKLTGETRLCETPGEILDGMTCQAAGQLITTFLNNPQLMFEDAELHFFGGERAPLASPAHCDPYTTNATFVPWSGTPPVNSTSTFNITSGSNGAPCPGASLPFSPSLTGGTTNINAGAFSPFTLTMSREDSQQALQGIQLHMPPGLSGLLSRVKLCGEAEANAGTCGPESLIGEDTVSAGVGSDPITVSGAKIYITGPYHGAPFGLSIVNPAKAGPFDLEHDTSNPNQQPLCDCIVVRAKIEVDPHTAALTVTTNSPIEGYAIPHIIDGIPLQLKHINVTINREHFTFNPTNCNPMALTGTVTSDEEAMQPLSVPFQATNCATLRFAPKFAVTTSGKTSKTNGASLSVKLVYPKAPFGSQANIAKVKVDLPKQLPSRLTTLQKACTAAQFKANPAGCPAASLVGHAKAVTPLIPVPLEGPAYFVSNGGEAFPNLILVLQGYGVRIDIVGDTFINKAGITSSTFKTVPDAPVGGFELTLPQGRFSALATNGNLCAGKKLTMPTEFVAQNGLKIHESTKIRVTGCPKAKRSRAQLLAAALKACRRQHGHKRHACEARAHKRYGPVGKAHKGAARKK